jgi:hypothetical protein
MFGDGSLTFREFVMREPLPLATIHDAVLEFLRGRTDAVLFGAQAVNAYVAEPRMTQDVDILSVRAADLAEELRTYLAGRFQIAVRIREVAHGAGHRIDQLRKPENRHLVDIRSVEQFPAHGMVDSVPVIAPAELICQKVISSVSRSGTAKRLSDLVDIARLLLTFPDLKTSDGPVAERLRTSGANETVLDAWRTLAAEEITPENDEAGY